MPFLQLGSNAEPVIKLAVVAPTKFELIEGFRYRDRYDDHAMVITVGAGEETDLASVPFFMQWLVRSYGRHTKAALVHDHLWGPAAQDEAALRKANRVFRHAMWELNVPLVRRWLMWAAVTLGMLAKSGVGQARLGAWAAGLLVGVAGVVATTGALMSWTVLGWIVLGGAGLAALGLGVDIVFGRLADGLVRKVTRGVVVAIVGLTSGAALVTAITHWDFASDNRWLVAGAGLVLGLAVWWRSIGGGLIATVAVAVLAAPIAVVLVAIAVYEVVEGVVLVSLPVLRWAKQHLLGREPKGTVNPLATKALQVELD